MSLSDFQSTLAPLCILVVDDHEINREFLNAGLSTLARRVDLANSGHQAIEQCRNNEYDVILMDLHMPQMDGLTTSERIRELGGSSESTPIIILTADTRPEEHARLRAAGYENCLTKPIALEELAAAIEDVIRHGRVSGRDGVRDDSGKILVNQDRALAAANQDAALAKKLQALLADELGTGLAELDGMIAEGRFEQAAARLHQWVGAGAYAGADQFVRSCRALRSSLINDLDSSPGTVYVDFLRVAHATRLGLGMEE